MRVCPARGRSRDVIHVLYDTQPGVNDAFDARRRNVITYLESISAVEALGLEREQAPPRLRQAEDRAVRKRIETIAEAIGCTLERESRTYRLQPDQGERQTRRRADLASAGLDVDALVKAANAGQPISDCPSRRMRSRSRSPPTRGRRS